LTPSRRHLTQSETDYDKQKNFEARKLQQQKERRERAREFSRIEALHFGYFVSAIVTFYIKLSLSKPIK